MVVIIGADHPHRIWVSGLAKQAVEQVDDVAARLAGHKNVVVFGSSRTWRGFDPIAYEAEVERRCGFRVRSWRFGFGFVGVSPTTQLKIAEHLGAALDRHSARWDLALVEFTPFQNTGRISEGEYGAGQDEWLTYLSSPADLVAQLPNDVDRSLRLLTYELFYEGSNPHRLTKYYADELFEAEAPKAGNPKVGALFARLRKIEPRWFSIPTWRADLRGANWSMSTTQFSPAARSIFDRIKAELEPERADYMERDRKWRVDCCDAQRLRLDPRQLAAFQRIIERFRAMARHSIVFLPPENRTHLPVVPEGDRAVDRFVSAMPIPVVDMAEDPAFDHRDFFDTTHLDEFGAAKFSTAFAARTARWLCPDRATDGRIGLPDNSSKALHSRSLDQLSAQDIAGLPPRWRQ